jgi:Tol biopolymer transport system component
VRHYAATPSASALATQVATLAISASRPTPSLVKLAYLRGGDIWVKALPDGEPQRVTTDARSGVPRWSPSGEWLAFRKGEIGAMWARVREGGSRRIIYPWIIALTDIVPIWTSAGWSNE